MEPIDIIIVVACVAIVVGVIVASIINKKKGKTGCGCDCSKCTGCPHSKVKDEKTDE